MAAMAAVFNLKQKLNLSGRKRAGLSTLLILCLLTCAPLALAHFRTDPNGLSRESAARVGLLLDSGLSKSTQAKVHIIFWLPRSPGRQWLEALPACWQWTETTSAPETQGPATVAGAATVTVAEERGILNLYQGLSAAAARIGGQAYLDERIAQPLDIFRYFSLLGVQPSQWAYSGTTFSLAGYCEGGVKPVRAGPDRINLQLLTRSHGGEGETVLAMPALLEEF
ncbi:Hypothetical protein DEACI_0351 [Acididesulfobacillus acetoxydans]|uniref:Uncharacterized protein n=1 Tax=Acididesulfobacillus acetoxydans TaxID=1561005 RepID=A0A8S0WKZ7_9FIRM|nr:hypothetical protein [Acididesulfobacillus acetoxydans]CAA7599724.1 Hypothetical protein DEACI_0351 [Acididesulfobacillus acetoxydans]CEJ06276.1 Hypothetical protein DEACI_0724 [Acididesulfobacillus acetoxydans]